MKIFYALALIACIGLFAAHGAKAEDSSMSDLPKLIVFHADYCGQCKILQPKLDKALSTLDKDAFTIIKFDYTSRETIMNSKDIAAKNNLTDIQKNYGAKTGFAVIVNRQGHEETLVSSSDTVEEITNSLNAALKGIL